MGEEMMEAPKSYESNGCRFDLVSDTYRNGLIDVNSAIHSANDIGLYTMVIPRIEYNGLDRYYLYFYKCSPIEVPK